MNVVDCSGWLEFFTDRSNAGFFARLITEIATLIEPTIRPLEVFERVLQAVAHVRQGGVVDLETDIALSATHLGVARKLPLADLVKRADCRHSPHKIQPDELLNAVRQIIARVPDARDAMRDNPQRPTGPRIRNGKPTADRDTRQISPRAKRLPRQDCFVYRRLRTPALARSRIGAPGLGQVMAPMPN